MERHTFESESEYADEVAQECHWLSGVDVRVKVVVAAAALLVTIGARSVALPLSMLVVGLGVCIAMRVSARLLLLRLIAPFGIALVVMTGPLFFWKGEPLFTLGLGPWQLAATQEGLQQGLLLGARVLGSVALVLVLSFSAPFQHLLAAARWFRAPAVMVDLASLIYRYLFLLREEAFAMMQAQRVRLGYADYRRGLRSAAALCGMSFARAYDRAMEIHYAMICRGYSGELQGEKLRRPGWREAAQVGISLVVLGAAGYLDLRLPLG